MAFWGRRGARRLVVPVVALFLSVLAASIVLQEPRWETTYFEGGADHAFWDPASSSLFLSDDSSLVLLSRDGPRFVREGVVTFRSPLGYELDSGPIAFDGRWVFIGTGDGVLVVIDSADIRFEGAVRNISFVDHGGPVYLGGIAGYGLKIRSVAVSGNTLFVAGAVEDFPEHGVVLALDVAEPDTITQDRSSVKVLYNLTFEGVITHLELHGRTLFAAEWPAAGSVDRSRVHVLDVSSSPPVERSAWNSDPTHAFDIEDGWVAIISAWTNSISLHDRGGSLGRSRTLPGIPVDVRLAGDRAYVSWFVEPSRDHGLIVFSIPDLGSIVSMGFDWERIDTGELHSMPDGVLLVGDRGMALTALVARPSLLVSAFVQTLVAASGIVTALAIAYWTPRVNSRAARGRPQP